jgi:hypothetical protein
MILRLTDYFFLVGFFAFPAVLSAMATACFCGFPDFISDLMLDEIVLAEYPFFSGIASLFWQR